MDKLFDENRVVNKIASSYYSINYYIYSSNGTYDDDCVEYTTEEKIKDNNLNYIKNTNRSCFAQLPAMLTQFSVKHKEWPNRLLLKCNFKKHDLPEVHVTSGEIRWWTAVCKKHKMFPEYINSQFIKTGTFTLKIDTLDIKTMYIYLVVARLLQEEPYFVSAVKYLVNDKGINFYTAFHIASRCCISNTGHHIIPIGKKYPYHSEENEINKISSYNISYVTKLKKFLGRKETEDRGALMGLEIGKVIPRFNLHDTLDSITVTEKSTIKVSDLLKSVV